MSTFSDGVKAVDHFIAALVGVEVTYDLPGGICPGIDMPVVIGLCGKPGPHGPHRGDEEPPYISPTGGTA